MTKFIKYILCSALIISSCSFLTSCSAVIAVSKPDKKDLSVMNVGRSRNDIVRELGPATMSSVNAEGNLVESWHFKQGESKVGKACRAAFHLAADCFTLFLWELVGTPAEVITEKKPKMYVVTFDQNETVQNIEIIQTN